MKYQVQKGDIMPRVVHFELPAEDPERAIQFYERTFGWEFQKWQGPMEYWLIMTGKDEPGIDGGLAPKGENLRSVTNTIGVPSVDDYIEKAVSNGGEVVVPKMTIPGAGYLAYIKDTEGNVFGIMTDDTSAS
jgi:predicted enzyme related to lactoylglutathione lyase